MRRRQLVLVLAGATVSARAIRAQQKAMPVIGFLNLGSADKFAAYFTAFRNGLAAKGFVEGQNVAIDTAMPMGITNGCQGLPPTSSSATRPRLRSLVFRLR